MKVPGGVSKAVGEKLWAEAAAMTWSHMSAQAKARQYEDWASREDIGGVLARHMDSREIRVYLKDTLMKGYTRQAMMSHERPFRVLGLPPESKVVETYIKPHGRRLNDDRILCWGPASNWKAVVLSVYERAKAQNGLIPFAAILTDASGHFQDSAFRDLVQDAARRLGVERVVWLEH